MLHPCTLCTAVHVARARKSTCTVLCTQPNAVVSLSTTYTGCSFLWDMCFVLCRLCRSDGFLHAEPQRLFATETCVAMPSSRIITKRRDGEACRGTQKLEQETQKAHFIGTICITGSAHMDRHTYLSMHTLSRSERSCYCPHEIRAAPEQARYNTLMKRCIPEYSKPP